MVLLNRVRLSANIDVNSMYALYYIHILLLYVTFLYYNKYLTIDIHKRARFFFFSLIPSCLIENRNLHLKGVRLNELR